MNEYQKAFEIISCCDKCTHTIDNQCDQCECYKEFWKIDELVKKSVPKKVIEIETVYKCPSCDTYLLFKHENMCLRLENTQTYCSSCGQRLDWGEE